MLIVAERRQHLPKEGGPPVTYPAGRRAALGSQADRDAAGIRARRAANVPVLFEAIDEPHRSGLAEADDLGEPLDRRRLQELIEC